MAGLVIDLVTTNSARRMLSLPRRTLSRLLVCHKLNISRSFPLHFYCYTRCVRRCFTFFAPLKSKSNSHFDMSNHDAAWAPPAKIEQLFAATSGNQFSSINRPTAGAREEKEVPSGSAPVQLYSLGTPNGIKVSILLEELAEVGR